jgi:hypothetical protein
MRDTIFIGHANPQDNEFAKWLSAKLELEGYKAWCDLKNLVGGERDFWDDIQNVIENGACKYLLVFSKSAFTKDGIKDEFEFARSIAKRFDLNDFVIPLKIDDVPYEERIGLNRYNIIRFNESWLSGLNSLFNKLQKDNVPRNTSKKAAISDWILCIYDAEKTCLVEEEEAYYSSWWPIPHLPQNIYLFQYAQEHIAQTIIEEERVFPVIKHGNYLVSFEPNIRDEDEQSTFKATPTDSGKIEVKSILEGYESEGFPTLIDSENLLKRLLKKSFKRHMYEKGLRKKEMSNAQCFYYPRGVLDKNKATARYPNRRRHKNLVGKYYDKFWHFGISTQVRLSPFVCYSLKSHILFSDDGHNIWKSDARLHNARRSKGKRWFNEQWRDQLIAFINSLKRDQEKILIRASRDFSIDMPLLTEQFFSTIGYKQPKTKDRLDILHEDEDEFEYIDEPLEATEESQ